MSDARGPVAKHISRLICGDIRLTGEAARLKPPPPGGVGWPDPSANRRSGEEAERAPTPAYIGVELASVQLGVQVDCPFVLGQLRAAYGPYVLDEVNVECVSADYVVRSEAIHRAGYLIYEDGKLVRRTADRLEVLPQLDWLIGTFAVNRLTSVLLIHAGVVVTGGRAILLPAPSGSGKSTLVAALISAGFEYLSDEVAAVDPRSGMVMPFARPLCLRQGAWAAFRGTPLERVAVPAFRAPADPVWYVPPPRRLAPATRYEASHIVLPFYDPTAPSQLKPVSRAVALARLIEQSVRLSAHRHLGVEALVRLVRTAECYELVVNELADATDLLRSLPR